MAIIWNPLRLSRSAIAQLRPTNLLEGSHDFAELSSVSIAVSMESRVRVEETFAVPRRFGLMRYRDRKQARRTHAQTFDIPLTLSFLTPPARPRLEFHEFFSVCVIILCNSQFYIESNVI